MNWLRKIPGARRAASGLEWVIWRKLPWILLGGTALLLLALLTLHWLVEPSNAATERWLQTASYMVIGALIFHWTAVVTVGIGCVIVMVMKGPAYAADSYPVSHSDQPRQTEPDQPTDRT
jgi:uncharacterized membrane protein